MVATEVHAGVVLDRDVFLKMFSQALANPHGERTHFSRRVIGQDHLVGIDPASAQVGRRSVTLVLPHRVSADRFRTLIEECRRSLPPEALDRLRPTAVRAQAMPTTDQVRTGVDPDELTLHDRAPLDVLVIFQVNHENRCGSEDALRELLTRSLTRA